MMREDDAGNVRGGLILSRVRGRMSRKCCRGRMSGKGEREDEWIRVRGFDELEG